MSAPTIPVLTDAFFSLFAEIEAYLTRRRAEAEMAVPGSGMYFDPIFADLEKLKAQTNVPEIAGLFLQRVGQAFSSGRSIVVPRVEDLSG